MAAFITHFCLPAVQVFEGSVVVGPDCAPIPCLNSSLRLANSLTLSCVVPGFHGIYKQSVLGLGRPVLSNAGSDLPRLSHAALCMLRGSYPCSPLLKQPRDMHVCMVCASLPLVCLATECGLLHACASSGSAAFYAVPALCDLAVLPSYLDLDLNLPQIYLNLLSFCGQASGLNPISICLRAVIGLRAVNRLRAFQLSVIRPQSLGLHGQSPSALRGFRVRANVGPRVCVCMATD